MNREVARCRREIAEIEALLRSGHPDIEGLCLALSDWWAELRLIEQHPMTGWEQSTPGTDKEEPPSAQVTGGGEECEEKAIW